MTKKEITKEEFISEMQKSFSSNKVEIMSWKCMYCNKKPGINWSDYCSVECQMKMFKKIMKNEEL